MNNNSGNNRERYEIKLLFCVIFAKLEARCILSTTPKCKP
jgi:hypothetical protein